MAVISRLRLAHDDVGCNTDRPAAIHRDPRHGGQDQAGRDAGQQRLADGWVGEGVAERQPVELRVET